MVLRRKQQLRLFVPEEGKIWRSPHEAMGIAGGDVRFGGKQGRIFKLNVFGERGECITVGMTSYSL